MPIYEYECRQCSSQFELLVLRTSDAPVCPECQSPDLEQLLSGFAVSSASMTKAAEAKKRQSIATSSRTKDHKVAEKEYFTKEYNEHRRG